MQAVLSNQEEWDDPAEDPQAAFAARLTQAAYAVALRHGVKGSFADLELALWHEMEQVVASAPPFLCTRDAGESAA